jgi:hypothetical protein
MIARALAGRPQRLMMLIKPNIYRLADVGF